MTEQTSDDRFDDFIVGMRQLAGEITEERNTELDEDRWNKKERQIIALENAANLLDEAQTEACGTTLTEAAECPTTMHHRRALRTRTGGSGSTYSSSSPKRLVAIGSAVQTVD